MSRSPSSRVRNAAIPCMSPRSTNRPQKHNSPDAPRRVARDADALRVDRLHRRQTRTRRRARRLRLQRRVTPRARMRKDGGRRGRTNESQQLLIASGESFSKKNRHVPKLSVCTWPAATANVGAAAPCQHARKKGGGRGRTDGAVEDRDSVHDRRAVLRHRRQVPAVSAHVRACHSAPSPVSNTPVQQAKETTYRSRRTRRSSAPAPRVRWSSGSPPRTRTLGLQAHTHHASASRQHTSGSALTVIGVHERAHGVLRVARERGERDGLAADVNRGGRDHLRPGAHINGLAARCPTKHIRQLWCGRAEGCRELATHG